MRNMFVSLRHAHTFCTPRQGYCFLLKGKRAYDRSSVMGLGSSSVYRRSQRRSRRPNRRRAIGSGRLLMIRIRSPFRRRFHRARALPAVEDHCPAVLSQISSVRATAVSVAKSPEKGLRGRGSLRPCRRRLEENFASDFCFGVLCLQRAGLFLVSCVAAMRDGPWADISALRLGLSIS